ADIAAASAPAPASGIISRGCDLRPAASAPPRADQRNHAEPRGRGRGLCPGGGRVGWIDREIRRAVDTEALDAAVIGEHREEERLLEPARDVDQFAVFIAHVAEERAIGRRDSLN